MDINMTLVGQVIAMIAFVWFCMKFVWPFIMDTIETRQTEIANGLAAAESGNNALANAKIEVDKILARGHRISLHGGDQQRHVFWTAARHDAVRGNVPGCCLQVGGLQNRDYLIRRPIRKPQKSLDPFRRRRHHRQAITPFTLIEILLNLVSAARENGRTRICGRCRCG